MTDYPEFEVNGKWGWGSEEQEGREEGVRGELNIMQQEIEILVMQMAK